MPSLFLSHSSVDKPFVEKLAFDLDGVGVDVWFDKWAINVGDSLTWRIEEGIKDNEYLGLYYHQTQWPLSGFGLSSAPLGADK